MATCYECSESNPDFFCESCQNEFCLDHHRQYRHDCPEPNQNQFGDWIFDSVRWYEHLIIAICGLLFVNTGVPVERFIAELVAIFGLGYLAIHLKIKIGDRVGSDPG